MTNDPANIAAILRTFIIYAVCAVLAIIVGNLMTNPWTYVSLGFVGLVLTFLALPLLMRWHHPLMVLCWGMPISLFFVKGDPKLYLAMISISLAISILERTLNQRHFIRVPSVTAPLICLIGVVLITAKLTGGIGLHAFGSEVYGGKKYIFLIVAILGYFALSARPIPPEKARLYVTLFFAGGLLAFIGDFAPVMPHFLWGIYYLIPPSWYSFTPSGFDIGTTRLLGTGWAGGCIVNILIARYGLRGIFRLSKLWRPALFLASMVLIFFGGFRSALILTAITITLQFFLEGLHRTKLMPLFAMAAVGCAVAVIPLAPKLPFTFQRALAFLPREWAQISPDARLDAQATLDWRLDMWKALLPEIPEHLLLGKGYAITTEDYQMMGQTAFTTVDPSQEGLALASDYHNGPLSVILPFGIWGVIAFGWFVAAALRVVYCNYRYGDPSVRTVNTFLFTSLIVTCISFLGSSLADGMGGFTGILGLSVCINRGICRAPARAARRLPVSIPFAGARLRAPAAAGASRR
jgi:hypothetical protein